MEAVIKIDAQLDEFQQQLSNINIQKQNILNEIQSVNINIVDLQKKIENIDAKK
jgi:archaellum component FlaC